MSRSAFFFCLFSVVKGRTSALPHMHAFFYAAIVTPHILRTNLPSLAFELKKKKPTLFPLLVRFFFFNEDGKKNTYWHIIEDSYICSITYSVYFFSLLNLQGLSWHPLPSHLYMAWCVALSFSLDC